jgi:DNA-binding transcriptional LysR family regulator
MNLEHTKLFVLVYRAGNFASVAKELDIAASSVSRAIANLENKLQTRLFQRTTRNLTPTESGEQYFKRVEGLIEEFEIAELEVTAQSSEPFGRLRVSTSISFGQAVIAPLLTNFRDKYPNIMLELTLADMQSNLVNDQFDVAIRHGRLNDSSLVARKLLDVSYLLVASPDYIKQKPPVNRPKDLHQHELISFSYSEFNKEWQFSRDDLNDVIPIKPVLMTTTALAIKECVKGGMGIAVLPDWVVREDLTKGSLVHLLPDWKVTGNYTDTAVWLVYPSRKFVPAKTTAFIEYLFGFNEKS